MKKLIFFVLFVCFASLVHAQSSQSIGLKFSYFEHNSSSQFGFNRSLELGVLYNKFFREKHGIVTGISINRINHEIPGSIFSPPVQSDILIKAYHATYSLHYMHKHNQWFVKSGLNAHFFNTGNFVYEDDILVEKRILNTSSMLFFPEIHFGFGRDFDLKKINIRVNAFLDAPFINRRYFDYGGELVIFYKLNEKQD